MKGKLDPYNTKWQKNEKQQQNCNRNWTYVLETETDY